MNSLAGKVAGVNINASSSGAGGCYTCSYAWYQIYDLQTIMHLYVIDGVPIFNTNERVTLTDNIQPNREERAYLISIPEDIESMSVF